MRCQNLEWGSEMQDEENHTAVISATSFNELDEAESIPALVEPEGFEEVLQAQKLVSLGVLAGGIAHDFNNILTGVLGNAELALASLTPGTPVHEYVLDVELAARRAADLSRELLAYAGKEKLTVEPLDLSELIDEARQLVAVSLAKKPRITYELPRDIAAIEADATQMRQILLNLITNAAEAGRDSDNVIAVRSGEMSCDAEYLRRTWSTGELEPGPYVFLEVSDSGIGMDEETRSRIFQPFFTTKVTGRGLGLAAVVGIVQRHGGAIQVASVPEEGTRIRVLFPATDRPVAASTQSETDEEAWRGTGTVLIVDDEKPVLSVTAKMVEALGFTALTAADGREAVDIFAQHPGQIDLAIVDLTMPRLGGVEAIEEMRRLQSGMKTILMSGHSRRHMESQYAGDITGFIQKPFRMAELGLRLREALVAPIEATQRPAQDSSENDWVKLQEELAAYRNLSSEIELAQYDAALRLTRAAEQRSNKLSGRLSRISKLSAELAKELEVSEDGVRVLAAAAPFHDIGKIGVSDKVLRKPGPLSTSEWEIVKRHPLLGGELLSGLSSRVIEAAAKIALTHHERWDGSGYPCGLSGAEIPLFGRIVALADQYDALRSPRPYKPAFSHDEACDILLCGDGRTEPQHFDPEVLAAFDTARDRFAEVFDTYEIAPDYSTSNVSRQTLN
ncbi:MAG: response regulator [Acidobacteriota bacterium]|nr:response regulator [Acidobacteriota bacterium]